MLDCPFIVAREGHHGGRVIMSDGPTGTSTAGVTYWATINIKGDLTEAQLKGVVAHIKSELAKNVTSAGTVGGSGSPIQGKVVQAVRTSGGKSNDDLGPPISIGLNGGPVP
jgi:hypothetical protein